MSDFRPLLALVLLAVWTAGGLAMPVAHDLMHGAERVDRQEWIAHAHDDGAHDDHHHHAEGDAHGTEIQPFCPDRGDVELACTLCTSAPVATLARSAAPHPVEQASDALPSRHASFSADAAPTDARGPPTA